MEVQQLGAHAPNPQEVCRRAQVPSIGNSTQSFQYEGTRPQIRCVFACTITVERRERGKESSLLLRADFR